MGNRTIQFKKKPAKILYEFKLLWCGWECDSRGYVVEQDEKIFVVLTNHGEFYRANKKELEEKIKEYEQTIEDTKYALSLLGK